MPDAATTDADVVIAGGGIGGLAAAIGLRRRGISVVVCEQAPELKEVGAGLLLSPNAVRALDAVGITVPAQSARVIREWRVLDQTGRRLHIVNAVHQGTSTLSLHRAELQRLLRAQLPDACVRLACQISAATETANGVDLVGASGERVRGAIAIGADGIRSRVRACWLGPEPARYCGYVGWRAIVPWVPPSYCGEWLSESWGDGKRFGVAPVDEHRCYWYASANVRGAAPNPPVDHQAHLLALFGRWHAPIPELIRSTPAHTILFTPIHDRRRGVMRLSRRIALLGDAAHPMTPNLGQGACMALEDARVLADALSTAASLPDGLCRYDERRRARTTRVMRASRFMGHVIQLENPIATALRDAVLRLAPPLFSQATMRPLFATADRA